MLLVANEPIFISWHRTYVSYTEELNELMYLHRDGGMDEWGNFENEAQAYIKSCSEMINIQVLRHLKKSLDIP